MAKKTIISAGPDTGICLSFVQGSLGHWTMEVSDAEGGGSCFSYLGQKPGETVRYEKGVTTPGSLIHEGRIYRSTQGTLIHTGIILASDGTGRGVAWKGL